MNIADTIYQQVQALPTPVAREVLDFVEFLQARLKSPKSTETTNRQPGKEAISAFRGTGKGGTTQRLLEERRRKITW